MHDARTKRQRKLLTVCTLLFICIVGLQWHWRPHETAQERAHANGNVHDSHMIRMADEATSDVGVEADACFKEVYAVANHREAYMVSWKYGNNPEDTIVTPSRMKLVSDSVQLVTDRSFVVVEDSEFREASRCNMNAISVAYIFLGPGGFRRRSVPLWTTTWT